MEWRGGEDMLTNEQIKKLEELGYEKRLVNSSNYVSVYVYQKEFMHYTFTSINSSGHILSIGYGNSAQHDLLELAKVGIK